MPMATRKTKPQSEPKPEAVEAETVTETPEPKAKEKHKSVHPIEFYEASGIPYCKQCGAPRSMDLEGKPICPEQEANCPELSE